MALREQDRHFLWSLFVAVAVILAWKGIWEGLRGLPHVGEPFVLLFIGFAMLTFSGIIFKEFDPLGGLEKSATRVVHFVSSNPHKKEYSFKYHDSSQKKDVILSAERLQSVDRGVLIFKHTTGQQEFALPIHKVTEILHQGKTYWKM